MEIIFAQSIITRLIIHEVFKKSPGEREARFSTSNALVSFSNSVQDLIKKRLDTSFGKESNSFSVGIDDDSTHSFFRKIVSCNQADDSFFINCTSELCQKLASDLPSQTSGGYLIFVQGEFHGRFFSVTIKADKTEALRSSDNNLEVLTDIFLSTSAKFFKIALLSQLSGALDLTSVSSYEAVLFDEQFRNSSHLANFFHHEFCGFDVRDNAKIKTKNYYQDCIQSITNHFRTINYHDGNEIIDKILIDISLKTKTVISASDFANTHLETPYLEIFREEIVSKYPNTFVKDPILIDRSTSHKNIFFDEVKITGPTYGFNDSIQIIESAIDLTALSVGPNVDYTIVKIKGYPKSVKPIKPKARQ